MNKKSLAVKLSALALAATLCIGGSVAYLTDSKRATNKFQVGKVEIELNEPNWKEPDNQKIVPTQNIKKDPQLTNTGKNDAFVYLEVLIPLEKVITALPDGTRKENGAAASQELFTFSANSGWTLLDKKENAGKHMAYTYSYDQILTPGKKTNALFDSVTFANVIEGQIDENKYDIGVHGFAIQSANTGDGSGSVPAEARKAYEKYVNQNINQPGAVTF